jgi:hypothetical protein
VGYELEARAQTIVDLPVIRDGDERAAARRAGEALEHLVPPERAEASGGGWRVDRIALLEALTDARECLGMALAPVLSGVRPDFGHLVR